MKTDRQQKSVGISSADRYLEAKSKGDPKVPVMQAILSLVRSLGITNHALVPNFEEPTIHSRHDHRGAINLSERVLS